MARPDNGSPKCDSCNRQVEFGQKGYELNRVSLRVGGGAAAATAQVKPFPSPLKT